MTQEIENGMKDVITIVEMALPAFVKAVKDAKKSNKIDFIIIQHQDAFAADYQKDDIMLLGYAIKYAGIYGIKIQIIGTNRDTLSRK